MLVSAKQGDIYFGGQLFVVKYPAPNVAPPMRKLDIETAQIEQCLRAEA